MMMCGNVTSRAGLGVEICEGSWHAHEPLVKKNNNTGIQALTREKEGPDSKRVYRTIGQAAFTLLPKGFAETVP